MATKTKRRTTVSPDLTIELGMPLKWAKTHNICEFWADFTQPASVTLGKRTVLVCTQDGVYADVYDKKGKEIGNISSGEEFAARYKSDKALLDAIDSGRLDVIEVSSFFIASDNARDSRLLDDEEGNNFLTITEALCAALAFLERGSLDENPSVDELHILDYVVTP